MSPHIACIWWWIITVVTFDWFYPTMYFQMFPQRIWPNGCKVTFIAFLWLFSPVLFHMISKALLVRGWKITFNTFVWFLSMYEHMSPQGICPSCCKIALVAPKIFICICASVPFQMYSQSIRPGWCKVTLIALTRLFSIVFFSYASLNCLRQWTQSRIGHICLTSRRNVFSNVSSNPWNWRMKADRGCNCMSSLLYFNCS